jgi:hypothetical protein
MPELKDYLGDGVYAEFDGFGIWLRANDPADEHAIFLEPEVLAALNRFAERCQQGKESGHAENQVP